MKTMNNRFGRWLKTKLTCKPASQIECADAVGVSAAAVSSWISGSYKPGREYLAPLARFLEVSVEELLKRL